jgi:8-oxo-dGTP pyrophosphatase MutT (NUDIX family)
MPHLHDLIDFVVTIFIVHEKKVLFIKHKLLNRWLPIGGHIELDEDPMQALYREIKEECGLDVEVIGNVPDCEPEPGTTLLIAPSYLDIHEMGNQRSHRHVSLTYFARAKDANAILAEREHDDIRWLSERDLTDPSYKLTPVLRFYAMKALEAAG